VAFSRVRHLAGRLPAWRDSLKKFIQAVIALAISTAALAQVDANRVVLTINGEEIKGAEYYRRMEFLPNVGMRLGDRYAEFPPGFMTIERLITERLVYQVAKANNCLPTEGEIQAEYARAKAENPKYVQDWIDSGKLLEDLLNQFKYELTTFKLVTRGITITDQEVDDYYKANKASRFTIPKRVKLRVIVVDSEEKKTAVDNELAAGKPFGEVAQKYSIDVTKVAQGEYGTVPLDDLAEPVRNALATTSIGKTTVWIPAKEQFVKFFKEDTVPETVIPLDDKVRRDIRTRLMLDKGRVKNDIAKLMLEARKNAKIDIKNKEFAEVYKKFNENYISQQEAKTGSK